MTKDAFGDRKLPSDISLNFPKYYPAFYYVFFDDEYSDQELVTVISFPNFGGRRQRCNWGQR
jgi:hypothetical protein